MGTWPGAGQGLGQSDLKVKSALFEQEAGLEISQCTSQPTLSLNPEFREELVYGTCFLYLLTGLENVNTDLIFVTE